MTDVEIPETMQLEAAPDAPKPDAPKSELEAHEPPPPFKDDVRASIAAKRRAQLEEEIAKQAPPEPIVEPEEIIENPAEPIAVEQEALPPVEPSEAQEPAAGSKYPEKVQLKIEGRDIEVPFETLTTLAQKGLASTKTWEEAARMREEAQRLMFSMQQTPQNAQPQAAKESAPQEPDFALSKEKAREIAKRINYGSEEDQVAALLDLGATIEANVQGRSQGLPQEQLIDAATQKALAIISAQQEQETLKREFPDILADYPLSMATDTIANQLAYKYQQEGKQIPRLELFREAGKITRERYLRPEPPAQPPVQAAPTVIPMDDKIERKRAAPKSPAPANKVATEPPPVYGANPSAIINQMRKSRGQPVYS